MKRLRVIQGGGRPRPYRRPAGERQQWVCGCGCSTLVKVKLEVSIERGKVRGTDALVCVRCLQEGKIVTP